MVKNLIVAVIFTLVSLVAAEGGLALLGYGALYKSGISRLHDPHLLYRLPPSFAPDIDANGFRNPSIDGPFDIVVLGDSHTYGYGVVAAASFPRLLEVDTGLRTYNFGMGGFGPAQYAYLADRALDLEPSYLVIAVFLGNDVNDACSIANNLEHWRDHYRAHDLMTSNCGGEYRPSANGRQRSVMARLKAAIKSTRTGSLLNQYAVLPLKAWAQFNLMAADSPDTLIVDDRRLRTLLSPWQTASAKGRDGLIITKHFSRISFPGRTPETFVRYSCCCPANRMCCWSI